MPIIQSATKRARQADKRRVHNLTYKNAIKERSSELLEAIAKKDVKSIDSGLSAYYKAIDKAVKRNVLNKKTAARRKSRFNRLAKESKGVTKAKAIKKSTPKTAAKKPAAKKPAAKKTVAKKPVAKKPVAKKPAATKKATSKTTTKKSTK